MATSTKSNAKAGTKRAAIKKKVAEGEQRNAERSLGDYARDARDEATSFVKAHPIATVAGGLALGVLVASMVPGPGKRLRHRASRLRSIGVLHESRVIEAGHSRLAHEVALGDLETPVLR